MKTQRSTSLSRLLAFTVAFWAGSLLGAANWSENYDESLESAKSNGRPMLLLFTGSDWCPPCMQLDKNVFQTQAFADFAAEHVVLMKADFPRAKQDDKIAQQNAALQRQFPIQGYPTVLLLDADTNKVLFAQGGFGGQSAEKYVEGLRAAIAENRTAQSEEADAEASDA